MSDFDEPAFPHGWIDDNDAWKDSLGLTIRQQAVLMAMQSLLGNPEITTYNDINRDYDGWIADNAICIADAVLRREMESRDEQDAQEAV